MALPTIQLLAPAPFAQFSCSSGNSYTASSLGLISASSIDVKDLLNDGCTYAITRANTYTTPGAPAIANATITVSSATLTAGTLTIGAQPDVPRQLAAIVTAQSGSTLTSAGLTLVYTANDGTTQTDALAFGLGTVGTVTTSKGVAHLTSATVAAVVGGGTATVQIGTTAYLAVPLEPGFVSWSVFKETKITPTNGTYGLSVPADETVSTTTISTGMISPTQAPDGTHWLSFGYTYTMPATYPA